MGTAVRPESFEGGTEGRLAWLERFSAVSKLILRRHWRDTLESAEYTRLGTDEAAELLTTMEWVVEAFTECLRERRSFDEYELARFHGLGAERAAQGIPLGALKESFRRGVVQCSREFTQVALEIAGPRQGQEVVDMLLRELFPLSLAAEDAVAAGYEDGRGGPEAAELGLTAQELRVLRLLPGLTNHQIATLLGSSPETVKSQVARILVKLGAHDRAHAVAIGMSHGVIADRFAARHEDSA